MFKHFFLFLTCLVLWNSSTAQSYDDYFAKFPTLTGMTTFKSEDMLKYPSTQKEMHASYLDLVYGKGEWAPKLKLDANAKVYPLGKMLFGKTVIVLFLSTSLSYDEKRDTQMSITAVSYKNDGTTLRGGVQSYVISFGGDVEGNTFMYSGRLETDAKSWLKVYQEGTGSAVVQKQAYTISSKGLSFDKNF